MKVFLFYIYFILASVNFCLPAYSEVLINEIYPNPKGQDQGKEWIELKNTGLSTINLEDWKLQIDKKEISLKEKIEPGEFLIIFTSLKNKNSELILSNKEQQIVDQINYTITFESKSYSRVLYNGKEVFIWTNPTQKTENKNLSDVTSLLEKHILPSNYNQNLIKLFSYKKMIITLEGDKFYKAKFINEKTTKTNKSHAPDPLILFICPLILSLLCVENHLRNLTP